MSILDWLRGQKDDRDTPAADTETVRKIVRELDSLSPERARFIGAFAYILGRVAHADLEISAEESRQMEHIVVSMGKLSESQAVLVVEIAKAQNRLFGGTENYLVTREFAEVSSVEERRELLHCLFAVSAVDESISAAEEAQMRQIASELGFALADYVAVRSDYSALREVFKPLLADQAGGARGDEGDS